MKYIHSQLARFVGGPANTMGSAPTSSMPDIYMVCAAALNLITVTSTAINRFRTD